MTATTDTAEIIDRLRRQAAEEVASGRAERDKAHVLRTNLHKSLHPAEDYEAIQRHERAARQHEEAARTALRNLECLG